MQVADALRRFGVSSTTRTLVLVRVAPEDAPPSVDDMVALVDGSLRMDGPALPLDAAGQLHRLSLDDAPIDWKELGKVYKLQDSPVFQTRDARGIEEIICSTVATKYIGN